MRSTATGELLLNATRKVSTWLGWGFVACFVIGNVVVFIFSLIHDRFVWALLLGICFAMFSVIMIAAHWRVIVSVVRSLPNAIHAAITKEAK